MAFFGFGKSENLYFPGCYTERFAEKSIDNYKRILKKLDIDFKVQKSFKCCGGFLDEAGYEKDLRKLARENSIEFKEKGYKKIITNCPLCCVTLKNYRDMIPEWDIDVEHIIITILNKLRENNDFTKNLFSDSFAYYDSCYLARYLNIINEPREILQKLGYNLLEFRKNREETICCGSCGGLMHTNPDLSEEIANNFIKMLKRSGIKKIITADVRDCVHLRKNLLKSGIGEDEIQVIEFSEAVCNGLNIKTS